LETTGLGPKQTTVISHIVSKLKLL